MSSTPEVRDVIVIGAGQAGLAVGYHLKRRGSDFVIVDAAPEVGQVWRNRWDSLRLFTPAEYDALPGLAFPAAAGTYPGKDDVAGYLEEYVATFALPVQLDTRVSRVRQVAGVFVLDTSGGTLRARQVVVATGPFQTPYIPHVDGLPAAELAQLHSAHYRNPGQLPAGSRVLVAGAANSGLQIADELARTHRVTVAVGTLPPRLPQRLLGRDIFHWLTRFGLMTKPADSRLARRLRKRGDAVIGSSVDDLRARGVRLRPRLVALEGRRARFADRTSVIVDAVVWATGYRSDYGWLEVPRAIVDGQLRHHRGVTDVPGLHVIGLPWQTSRGSALLGFVAADAQAVADRIDAAGSTTTSMRRSAVGVRAEG